LFVVRSVRPLEPLLPGPVVAQVDHGVEAGGAGADHDHAARLAYEYAGRNCSATGMLEDDGRVLAAAGDLPELLPERRRASHRLLPPGFVVHQRRYAPMAELTAVDIADRAVLHRVRAALIIRDDRDGPPPGRLDELGSLGSEATRATPDQDEVTML